MRPPRDSYHAALNLLVVANLFASGLLAGCFIWLWLMLPPDTAEAPVSDCRYSCSCDTTSVPASV